MTIFKSPVAVTRATRIIAVGAGLILTAVSAPANPAAAFGLGSMGDVSKALGDAGKAANGADAANDDAGPGMPMPGSPLPNVSPTPGMPHAAARSSDPVVASPAKPATPPVAAVEPSKPASPTAPPATAGMPGMAPVAVAPMPGMPAPAAASTPNAVAPGAGAPATIPVTASGAEAKPGELPAKQPDRTADYYGDRAKEVLAEEQKTINKLLPIQLAAPDYDMVVCEAGCREGKGPIVVSKKLKTEKVSAVAEKTAGMVVRPLRGDCRGGCYDAPSGLTKSGTPSAGMLGEEAGNWMTTVTTGEAASTTAEPSKTAAQKKAARDDWMARINRERAAEKGQPVVSPAAPKS